eukprot:TRINITY_DN7175_c0_g1_i1.p1 TRINITY_DN7175_c0_g1~~TRINITY_DN7175_c0_g1_i1.p1  ORF type:complete len:158 (-),score=21.01 TRINITY_DN7175_c0_g1_i1:109-582(-)
MNFTLYPYGNAKETQNPDGTWKFTCQHGNNECIGNMIFACAMHFHPDPKDYFPFVDCMEENSSPATAGKACASKFKLDWSEIDDCTTSKLGNSLMHQVAVATNNLSPRHQWTPWVVLNGKPLSQSQLDQHLIKLVCAAYQGSDKPSACNKLNVCINE